MNNFRLTKGQREEYYCKVIDILMNKKDDCYFVCNWLIYLLNDDYEYQIYTQGDDFIETVFPEFYEQKPKLVRFIDGAWWPDWDKTSRIEALVSAIKIINPLYKLGYYGI